ncbi:hypothetical protein B0O99DRAFT_685455 [Bisporella sp. PMI_857]|nr:hypothetical protein B0O99DRAFT_685455 [Bisporella sp. PMI_857]
MRCRICKELGHSYQDCPSDLKLAKDNAKKELQGVANGLNHLKGISTSVLKRLDQAKKESQSDQFFTEEGTAHFDSIYGKVQRLSGLVDSVENEMRELMTCLGIQDNKAQPDNGPTLGSSQSTASLSTIGDTTAVHSLLESDVSSTTTITPQTEEAEEDISNAAGVVKPTDRSKIEATSNSLIPICIRRTQLSEEMCNIAPKHFRTWSRIRYAATELDNSGDVAIGNQFRRVVIWEDRVNKNRDYADEEFDPDRMEILYGARPMNWDYFKKQHNSDRELPRELRRISSKDGWFWISVIAEWVSQRHDQAILMLKEDAKGTKWADCQTVLTWAGVIMDKDAMDELSNRWLNVVNPALARQ